MKKNLRHVIWGISAFVFLTGCATNLQVAAYRGNGQDVMELLENGESISERDIRGLTALHYAAQGGQETIVDLLLNKGAEINARGNRGETPLYVATYYCHENVIRALLERGANFTFKFKNDNEFSMTPLLIASASGCDPTILKELLKAGADANGIDDQFGWSPLIFAANIGNLKTVGILLCAGGIVNHQAYDGITALIAAAGKGSKEVVQALLAAGADQKIRANQGRGPLNSDLKPTDTALSVAKRRGHSEVVALLEAAEKKNN
ncbi:MAG: ankyrin repeat domain-containing protein [Nitrospira sp.]|nr:ankyrin repeat domain-containing protein [Nitrospira sp.]